MPSNADLIKSITAVSAEIGVDAPDTEGKNNGELASILSALKAADKKPAFYVKEGKAVTSKRGILSDGDEIKASDLAGGKDALEAFVKSGHVAKG